jgi:hypothetical protein
VTSTMGVHRRVVEDLASAFLFLGKDGRNPLMRHENVARYR